MIAIAGVIFVIGLILLFCGKMGAAMFLSLLLVAAMAATPFLVRYPEVAALLYR